MKVLLLILFFLIINALLIISNNDLRMYQSEDAKTFLNFYSDWINKIYINAQYLTGNIIKLKWLPESNI